MTAAQIKQALKDQLGKLGYLSAQAKANALAHFNKSVSGGANAAKVFCALLEDVENSVSTPQEILYTYEASASLLGDKSQPKSKYQEWCERVQKKWGLNSLSFHGMEQDKPANIQKTNTEQKVSLGSQAKYQGKTFDAALEITVF